MSSELDYSLTRDQWETLKALRGSAPECRRGVGRIGLDRLVDLGLARIDDGLPAITAKGRSVLLRGSPQLLDVVA